MPLNNDRAHGDNSPAEGGAGPVSGTEAVEQAVEQALAAKPPRFELVLYVAGLGPRSLRAITNARALCAEFLSDCHTLTVVDIYQDPAEAEAAGILAVPALLKKTPLPAQRFVGDLSNRQRVIDGLGLQWVDGGQR